MVGGLTWTLAVMGRTTSPPAEQPETSSGMAVRGRHRPSDYGLPAYRTAFEFNSLVVDRNTGSVAYSLKGGTAQEVVAYYREQLPKDGWHMESERPTSETPGEGKGTSPVSGRQQIWTQARSSRRLILLALDYQHGPSTGQVVLSWSPGKP